MSDTVAEAITRLQNAKSSIKTSIENKWVAVPSNAKIDEYSWYIDQITSWWDPRWKFLVSTILRTWNVTSTWSWDNVVNFWSDMTYADNDVMILVKPRYYDDYSSSWHSTMTVYLSAFLLDWTTLDFQTWTASVWWYWTNWYLRSDSFIVYKEWDNIHFKIRYYWYWSERTSWYPTLDLIYNKSTNTWSQETWDATSTWSLPNTGSMNLYTSDREVLNKVYNIKRTPVLD